MGKQEGYSRRRGILRDRSDARHPQRPALGRDTRAAVRAGGPLRSAACRLERRRERHKYAYQVGLSSSGAPQGESLTSEALTPMLTTCRSPKLDRVKSTT
jgi:hypothetical protein